MAQRNKNIKISEPEYMSTVVSVPFPRDKSVYQTAYQQTGPNQEDEDLMDVDIDNNGKNDSELNDQHLMDVDIDNKSKNDKNKVDIDNVKRIAAPYDSELNDDIYKAMYI